MQRLLAILILSVVGILPVTQAWFTADSAQALPACCRTHGKHKCAMPSGDEPALHAVCSQYPYVPVVSSTAVNPWIVQPASSPLNFAAVISCPVAHAQIEALFRVSFERSRQKRGPPSFLL